MAFELKDGQGSFFRNDKQGIDSRPDYRGELNVNGTMYRISGWVKEGKSGKWMSLSVTPKDDPQERRAIQSEPRRQSAPKDDLPW